MVAPSFSQNEPDTWLILARISPWSGDAPPGKTFAIKKNPACVKCVLVYPAICRRCVLHNICYYPLVSAWQGNWLPFAGRSLGNFSTSCPNCRNHLGKALLAGSSLFQILLNLLVLCFWKSIRRIRWLEQLICKICWGRTVYHCILEYIYGSFLWTA